MKNLGAIIDNLDIATKQYVDENGGETEVMIQDDEPTVDFKIWIDTNDNTYGDDTVSIAGGGTGANTSAGARGNLIVPQKPKLLWWGVFSNGSITVDGLSDYTHFLIQMNGTLLLGTVSSGIISLGTFQCDSSAAGWATLMTANVAVNGDTLTMNHTFYVSVNNTNWYQSAADTHVQINGIWGLYKAEDMQGE